jgi:hypothetical protein
MSDKKTFTNANQGLNLYLFDFQYISDRFLKPVRYNSTNISVLF